MADPAETVAIAGGGAVGGGVLFKLFQLFLGRHFKKQDDTDTRLDLILEAVRKVGSDVQKVDGRVDALERSMTERFHSTTNDITEMKTKADGVEERMNKVAASHRETMGDHTERIIVIETILRMQGLSEPRKSRPSGLMAKPTEEPT